MKICITSTGDNLDSNVDPRFGRCRYFIIYNTDTDEFEAMENDSREAMGGAGISAAQNIVSKNVQAVLSGHFGPNAFKVLQSASVKLYSNVSGTVRTAIAEFKNNDLKILSSPDAPSHFGMGN